MNKLNCPNCNHQAITSWAKLNLSPLFNKSCDHCGVNLTIPFWGLLLLILPITLPFVCLQFEYVRSAFMNEYLMVFMLSSISIGVIIGFILFVYNVPLVKSE
jgi:hypothetical protein